LITATVHGVGTATTGLSLEDENGFSLCQSLTITAYSKIECLTSRGHKLHKEKKYCTNYKKSLKNVKSIDECSAWVAR